jgi:hypothetical protein
MTSHSLFSRLLAVLIAITIALPSAAWADDAAAAAAEYYNQATLAYQQGDYQKAADLLDQAFGKNPDLVYKYNRILALQALGDYKTALAELNTMIGPMKADGQNRFEDVEQIQAQLEAAVAAQTDDPNPEGDPIEEPDPVAPVEKGPNYLALGLIGGGIALLGTGIVFVTGVLLPRDVKTCLGLLADSDGCEDYFDSLGDDDEPFIIEDEGRPPRPGTIEDAEEFARDTVGTHQVVAVTLMAGGAVIGAVGAILLVLDSGSEAPPAQSVQFFPVVGPDRVGAGLQLRF